MLLLSMVLVNYRIRVVDKVRVGVGQGWRPAACSRSEHQPSYEERFVATLLSARRAGWRDYLELTKPRWWC